MLYLAPLIVCSLSHQRQGVGPKRRGRPNLALRTLAPSHTDPPLPFSSPSLPACLPLPHRYHLAVRYGADIDAGDNDGRSPLHWAAYKVSREGGRGSTAATGHKYA